MIKTFKTKFSGLSTNLLKSQHYFFFINQFIYFYNITLIILLCIDKIIFS